MELLNCYTKNAKLFYVKVNQQYCKLFYNS